jgi:uncharacterized membrane protein
MPAWRLTPRRLHIHPHSLRTHEPVGSGTSLLTGTQSYEDSEVLIRYWVSFTVDSVSVSVLAGVAGTLLVISQRSVLTAGVMMAVALNPTATMIGMGLVAGDFQLAGSAAVRFAVEGVIIVGVSVVVFWGKRVRAGRPHMSL